jgi:hypothetical protein
MVAQMSSVSVLTLVDKYGLITENSKYVDEAYIVRDD